MTTPTYFECLRSIRRARLGHLLTNDRLSRADAQEIIAEVEYRAGWYAIATLCVEDILEQARFRWSNPAADIEEAACYAAARVARKFEFDMHNAWAWALDEIESYAGQVGLILIEGEREVVDEPFIIE